jgi:hypothetical protein
MTIEQHIGWTKQTIGDVVVHWVDLPKPYMNDVLPKGAPAGEWCKTRAGLVFYLWQQGFKIDVDRDTDRAHVVMSNDRGEVVFIRK